MLNVIEQDISCITEGVIIHGVNNLGAMKSGVAWGLRQKHPSIFTVYSKVCKEVKNDPTILLGEIIIVEIEKDILYIINCFTQDGYGYDNKKYAIPSAIQKSVNRAFVFAQAKSLPLYMPKIGCKRGGLDWQTEVEPIINELVTQYGNVDTYICTYKEK